MTGTNLQGSNLTGAQLVGTKLDEAQIHQAIIAKVDLTVSTGLRLQDLKIAVDKNLNRVDLHNQNRSRADLSGAIWPERFSPPA